MPTNCVIEADKIIEPENMNLYMKMIVLNDGSTVFVNTMEEYQRYVSEGNILGFQG